MYHLPLLPGYGPNANIRSSVPLHTPGRRSFLSRLSEAEENGYQDTYFASSTTRSPTTARDGYFSAGSPIDMRKPLPEESEAEAEEPRERPQSKRKEEEVAEVVFFQYGVVVFFGLEEGQEKSILEDLTNAGILKRAIKEDDWEVEECHFTVGTRRTDIVMSLLTDTIA